MSEKELELNRIYEKMGFKEKRTGIASIAINSVRDFISARFFDNNPPTIFNEKYLEAISGSGDEMLKMDAPYSSSLCAFLFFVNVSGNNPIFIEGTEYDEVFFEVKNKVFDSPSNMDVVLRNEAKKELLFIECKFSEYLENKKTDVSPKYLSDEVFNKLANKGGKLSITDDESNGKYQARYEGREVFTYGIKQIIAHLIGLNNYKKKIYYKGYNDDRKTLYNSKYNVRFVEVIFDLKDIFPTKFDDYHNSIIELRSHYHDDNYFLEPTTYQKLLEKNPLYKLPKPIMDFYKY